MSSGKDDDMALAQRVARTEGVIEGIKLALESLSHGQNLIIAVMGLGFTLLIGLGVYGLQRVDNLPAELQGIANGISQAVTASKQAPPQVILMPAPAPAPAAPSASK